MNERDPFRHISPPEKLAGTAEKGYRTGESEIFQYESQPGVYYIRKKLKYGNQKVQVGGQEFMDGVYLGKTIEEVAAKRRRFYEILKKHLGDYVVDTDYVIAEDDEGNPQINIIQKKVDGISIQDLIQKQNATNLEDLKLDESIKRQLFEIRDIYESKVENDLEAKKEFGSPYITGENGQAIRILKYPVLTTASWEIIPYYDEFNNIGGGNWKNILVDNEGKLKIIDW